MVKKLFMKHCSCTFLAGLSNFRHSIWSRSSCETTTTAFSVVSLYVGSVSKSQLHVMFMNVAASGAFALPLTLSLTLFKEDPE